MAVGLQGNNGIAYPIYWAINQERAFDYFCYHIISTWQWIACSVILGKILTGPTNKLLLSSTDISNVYRSLIEMKITFAKYCLTQSKAKYDLGLAVIVNAIIYMTERIFTGLDHGKLF